MPPPKAAGTEKRRPSYADPDLTTGVVSNLQMVQPEIRQTIQDHGPDSLHLICIDRWASFVIRHELSIGKDISLGAKLHGFLQSCSRSKRGHGFCFESLQTWFDTMFP